jgi:hypothetical protein
MEQATLKHEMKLYYFTAVIIFKHNRSTHLSHLDTVLYSLLMKVPLLTLSTALLICTVQSTMKTLSKVRTACDIIRTDEG